MSKNYKNDPIKVPRFKESEGFYTSTARSKHMSKIRGKDTKPEILFRKALYQAGIRYRVNVKNLPGKPDIVNASKGFIVFIDGEFWHGFNWEEKRKKIKANRGFWIPKIERNIQKDKENNLRLEKMGFRVFRFWEHEIKQDINACVSKVVNFLQMNN